MPITSGQPIVLQTIDEKIIELQQKVRQISTELILIDERITQIYTELSNDYEELSNSKVDRAGDIMTGPLEQWSQNIDIDVVPSTTQWDSQYRLRDKNGAEIGALYAIRGSDDKLGMQMEVSRTVNGTRYNNNIRLYLDNTGVQSVSVSNASAWQTALSVLPLSGGTLTGGLTISSGGLTVNAGGAKITGTTLGKIAYFTARQTTPNINGDGVVGLSHFLSTASMNSSGLKPNNSDGHIIHMAWDNTGQWDVQLAVQNGSTPNIRVRSQNGKDSSGHTVWTAWKKVYTEDTKPSKSDVGLGKVTNQTETFSYDSNTKTLTITVT